MKMPLLKRTSLVPKILLSVILSSTGVSHADVSAARASDDAFSQCRQLGRGVNVLGYDPIWESFDKARFRKEYFNVIRTGGFDTLRANLFPFNHMDAGPGYQLSDSWWGTMDWIVTNALAVHLNVIVDFHEFEVMGKDAQGNKDRFLAFWRQAAPHFRKAPSNVVFEILNEPNGKMTSDIWNEYLAEALAIIRQSNPTRTVIIGPASWNSIDQLDELKLPDQDRHIVVTVHYYKPMDFTHQGAPWVKPQYKVGVVWKGTAEEREAIESDFQKVQDWAKQHDRPVLLGEFGAYEDGDMASRARYTACVARTAEQFNWSWAYWQFDKDFIVYNIPKNQWVEPIYHALIPSPRVVALKMNNE
ncbi:MAG TPA: glycoside hydrolase family 5 protein [Candidatus Limnocylindrales bacterium]|nr:glycoside hydrolase family 5 protein [Candidatus Limnocylindrales bacterium]